MSVGTILIRLYSDYRQQLVHVVPQGTTLEHLLSIMSNDDVPSPSLAFLVVHLHCLNEIKVPLFRVHP